MFFSLMFYKAMQSIIALSILLSFGLRSADGDVFLFLLLLLLLLLMMMMAQDRCKGAWSAFQIPCHG